MKEQMTPLFRVNTCTLSHDVLVFFDVRSLFSLRESCSAMNESVADSLSPIMVRLLDQSDFVSESAVGDIYRERKSKGDGRLRRVKSLSELNIDDMLARLCKAGDGASFNSSMTLQERAATRQQVSSFKTDARLLRWMYHNTRPRLWLIGGGSIVEGDKSYMRIDSGEIRAGKASEMSQMSRRRGTFFTDVKCYRGGIVVIGGESPLSIGTLELYNPMQNKWTPLPDIPERLQYSGSAVDKDDLLVSGGLDHSHGGCSDVVYRLSHSKKEWVREDALRLPDRRFGHASLMTADGKLWVGGGNIAAVCNADNPDERYELYNPSNSLLFYDTKLGEKAKWHQCAPMGATRIWHSLFEVHGHLYAVGGDADGFGKAQLPTIEKYDREQDAWETVTFFPEMRKIYSCTEHEGKIIVVGGRGADYSTVTSLREYDLLANRWSELPDLLNKFGRDSFIGGGMVVQTLSASSL